MAYVARQRLRWGEQDIEPGDPVPDDEPARDYAAMLHLGQITETSEAGGDTAGLEQERDDALERAAQAETERDEALATVEAVTAERDELARQLEDATAPAPAAKKPAAKK